MDILIKEEDNKIIINIGTKKIPKAIGLPVISNVINNNIIGHSWFNLVEKIDQIEKMPVYKFHHFKVIP